MRILFKIGWVNFVLKKRNILKVALSHPQWKIYQKKVEDPLGMFNLVNKHLKYM